MSTTGNVDRVGFSETLSYYRYYNNSGSATHDYINQLSACYSVLAMGDRVLVHNQYAGVCRYTWPYSGSFPVYRNNNTYYMQNYGLNAHGLFPDASSTYRTYSTYVRAWNWIVALRQDGETSGKYYQRLIYSTGRTQNLSWSYAGRPTGMPNTTFGSQLSTYTQSSTYIDQIGSTYEYLLLRIGDIVYFLNSSFQVVKTLDWSSSNRKPSLYNLYAKQFTADHRYLYFPARLLRGGIWGYYLEVFSIENGSFVNEILVTTDNSGNPGTTAMSFDFDNKRLVLGQQGGYKYQLFGKGVNTAYESDSYMGFLVFEQPDDRLKEVVSKPISTNLPIVSYKLSATSTLNSGTIDYYVRFNNEAWTKINVNQQYSWTNPGGAKDATIQIRALLKTSITASKAPELTQWSLQIKPFVETASFESLGTLLNLADATGGSIQPNQLIPSQSNIKWYIRTKEGTTRYPAGSEGSFDTELISGDANFVVEADLSTNNMLMSPVVYDYKVQLYKDGEGVFASDTFPQLHDINNAHVWITTSGSMDYGLQCSRDGGQTWEDAKRDSYLYQNDGDFEASWSIAFKGDSIDKRKFKIRMSINRSMKIKQYGAKLN